MTDTDRHAQYVELLARRAALQTEIQGVDARLSELSGDVVLTILRDTARCRLHWAAMGADVEVLDKQTWTALFEMFKAAGDTGQIVIQQSPDLFLSLNRHDQTLTLYGGFDQIRERGIPLDFERALVRIDQAAAQHAQRHAEKRTRYAEYPHQFPH